MIDFLWLLFVVSMYIVGVFTVLLWVLPASVAWPVGLVFVLWSGFSNGRA